MGCGDDRRGAGRRGYGAAATVLLIGRRCGSPLTHIEDGLELLGGPQAGVDSDLGAVVHQGTERLVHHEPLRWAPLSDGSFWRGKTFTDAQIVHHPGRCAHAFTCGVAHRPAGHIGRAHDGRFDWASPTARPGDMTRLDPVR